MKMLRIDDVTITSETLFLANDEDIFVIDYEDIVNNYTRLNHHRYAIELEYEAGDGIKPQWFVFDGEYAIDRYTKILKFFDINLREGE